MLFEYVSAVCLAFAAGVVAQAPQDPIQDFCRRFSQQTAVIDRKLYIDGGYVNANPISQYPDAVINQNLLYEDLDFLENDMPMLYANLSKNSSIPDVAGGILWADNVNKIFYLFGGEYSNVPEPPSYWGYDVVLNQWNATSTPPSTIDWVAWGAGTTVDARGEGYYYGGYMNNLTSPGWDGPQWATSGLVKYDMIGDFWTNNTGPDSIGRAEGVMVTIPASTQGLLVYFGGVTFPYGNTTEVAASMSTIYIYDIAEGKWYEQTATGEVPESRRKFCAGATWAQDHSSYNIYLYGGAGFGENVTGFDDVYILTLPTFEWIKWYPSTPTTGNPHNSLSCNVIDGAQMLIIGGVFPASDMCDAPDVFGTHNLDLGKNNPNATMWHTFNPNLTSYIVPSEIIEVVGGGPSGGATEKTPATGWDTNPDLEVYFGQVASYAVRTPTRAIPTATGAPSSNHHKTNTAIIGGAVGGGVGVLLIGIAVLVFCIRRRRRSRMPPPLPPPIQTDFYVPKNEMSYRSAEPSELPGRNSTMFHSPSSIPAPLYHERKTMSPSTSPPPASTRSPVHSSQNSYSPQPLIANPVASWHTSSTSPTNLDPRLAAHSTSPSGGTYHHPAHQHPAQNEYFPPPPARHTPTGSLSGPDSNNTILRPQPIGPGRSYELPTTRTPNLRPTRGEEWLQSRNS